MDGRQQDERESEQPREESRTAQVRNQILRDLTQRDIDNTLLLMRRINISSAYGHDPELCQASGRVIKELRQYVENQPIDPATQRYLGLLDQYEERVTLCFQ